MDDLIRRKDAIKAIEDLQDCYNGFSDTYDKACIIGVLEELPSAQPELVWCKECKFYDITHPYGTIVADAFHCKVNDKFYKASHFCGYGERRE